MRSEMNFVTAEQLAEMMGISKGHAYKIIHVLNEELQTKGFLTVWKDVAVYRSNAMMNANFFALGMAFVLFGCFNRIFIGGFFRTAYQFGKPFIMNMIVAFVLIGISEVLHHIPSLMAVNAFGFEHFGLQCSLLIFGIILYMLMTTWSYQRSCWNFERTDL